MKVLYTTVFLLSLLSVRQTNAEILLYETNFDSFADGNLVGQDGWAAHSGAGSTPIQVTGGAVNLVQGSGSREDVNIGLGQTIGAGEVFTYSFDLTVNGTADASNVYFAHFKDLDTGFNTRTFIAAPNNSAGNFTFGLSESSSSEVKFGTDFNFGQTYKVIGSYNYDLGTSVLEVVGFGSIASTTADPLQPMDSFAFRQAAGNTSLVIDNLRIVAVPEPSSLMLLGLCGAPTVLGLRRRRQLR